MKDEFKSNKVDQIDFNKQMDLLARFSDKSKGGIKWKSGMFANFVKGLVLFSETYEQVVRVWSKEYECK